MPNGPDLPRGNRLSLSQVTLCAVTSVNVRATVRALEACLAQVAFAECLLLTDAAVQPAHPEIRLVPIARLGSSAAYSQFMLSGLVEHIGTTHCLTAQWDGHVLDASKWRPEFLDFDYIGASWPQFNDGHDVGNGGFSLRSRRLMNLCRAADFRPGHPEDIAIGRTNRAWLESAGMCFASRQVADLFAAERSASLAATFGYHGVWNMPRAIGLDAFWEIYQDLDERGSVWHDFGSIAMDMARGRQGLRRATAMFADHHLRTKAVRR